MRQIILFLGCLQALLLTVSSASAEEFHGAFLEQRGESGDSSVDHTMFYSHQRLLRDGMELLNKNTTMPSERLKNHLLETYDKNAFPWEYFWNASLAKNDVSNGGNSLREGLEVEMNLNFHKVFEVSTAKSTADLLVWLRIQWEDPRLAWDPADYGNITTTFFRAQGGVESEIWTPDIELWNFESSLSDTMNDALAVVSSNGNVFWSRPGRIKPACKFQGLEKFPFDTLTCTMEFGSWARSGLYLRPVKLREGFSLGGSDTSGESFSVFTLKGVEVEEKIYPPYPSAPDEDWPVLKYHVSFSRAWEPIARGFLIVQILLNLTGFASLWFPVHSGERMGLCITSVLAAIASDLAVSSQLPLSNEVTWFSLFSSGSLVFGIFIVFQCVVVMYFYYCIEDNLQPNWFKWMCKKRSEQKGTDAIVRDEGHNTSNQDGGDDFYDESKVRKQDLINVVSHRNVMSNKSAKEKRDMEFYNSLEMRELENNRKWRIVAGNIDEVSRLIFPAAYVIFIGMIFAKL